MTQDAARWRRHGRHVRSLESMRGAPHAVTRAAIRTALRVALAAALAEVAEGERDEAIGYAVEGYLEEHLARGGSVEGS